MATKKFKLPVVKLLVLLVLIAAMAYGIYMYFFQGSTPSSKASQDAVSISVSPNTLAPNATQTLTINISTVTAGDTISGFELLFHPTPGLVVKSVGTPVLVPDAASSGLVNAISNVKRVAYVINAASSQLPTLVSIPVTVQVRPNIKVGTKLSLRLSANVIGPIPGRLFDSKKITGDRYVVTATSPTGSPVSPTPTPTTNPTQGLPPGSSRMPPQGLRNQ